MSKFRVSRASDSLFRPVSLVAGVCLFACTTGSDEVGTGRSPQAEVGHTGEAVEHRGEVEGADRSDAAPSWEQADARGRTRLLVYGHLPTLSAAEVGVIDVSLDVSGGLSAVGGPTSISAVGMEQWQGHYTFVAAHGGDGPFVVATGEAGAYVVELRESAAAERVRVSAAVGDTVPAALHLAGGLAFVGQGDRVTMIDFEATAPTPKLLRERPEMRFKAYDLFARDGAWLMAIDDEVTPIFADSIELAGAGAGAEVAAASVRAGLELPGVINGHYSLAILAATARDAGTLYAVVDYGVMHGHGHDLAALPIRADVIAVPEGSLINDGAGTAMPLVEEHVSRATGKPTQLAVGDHYSDWSGLARVPGVEGAPGVLLIAAGDRGLLWIREDFKSGDPMASLDIGGPCTDVVAENGRVWVLRATLGPAPKPGTERSALPKGSAVVELGLEQAAAGVVVKPVHTLELDTGYLRFVH